MRRKTAQVYDTVMITLPSRQVSTDAVQWHSLEQHTPSWSLKETLDQFRNALEYTTRVTDI